jgi:mRNA interferase HicA
MKRRDLIRHLEAHGCRFERDDGKHTVYINPATRRTASIPRHREINNLTARGICRQLGIPAP